MMALSRLGVLARRVPRACAMPPRPLSSAVRGSPPHPTAAGNHRSKPGRPRTRRRVTVQDGLEGPTLRRREYENLIAHTAKRKQWDATIQLLRRMEGNGPR